MNGMMCTKCAQVKPITSFHVDRHKKTGRHSQCKECHSIRNREKRATDHAWREKQCEKSREYKVLNPDTYKRSVRNSVLKAKYGMTVDSYEAMFDQQGRVCAICGGSETRCNGRMHVDHCHTTGQVRAILCQRCNTTLGKCEESPALLQKLAAYIEQHKRRLS